MVEDDEIEMALVGAVDDDDTSRKRARTGKMWLTAPAKNSPEIELRASKFEKCVPVDMEFGDEADAAKTMADPDVAQDHSDDARLYDFHISLARSLGEGAVWADYEAACKAEGVQPMPKY